MLCFEKTRMFDQDAPIRLPVHEVGVHAVRGANGRLQVFYEYFIQIHKKIIFL